MKFLQTSLTSFLALMFVALGSGVVPLSAMLPFTSPVLAPSEAQAQGATCDKGFGSVPEIADLCQAAVDEGITTVSAQQGYVESCLEYRYTDRTVPASGGGNSMPDPGRGDFMCFEVDKISNAGGSFLNTERMLFNIDQSRYMVFQGVGNSNGNFWVRYRLFDGDGNENGSYRINNLNTNQVRPYWHPYLTNHIFWMDQNSNQIKIADVSGTNTTIDDDTATVVETFNGFSMTSNKAQFAGGDGNDVYRPVLADGVTPDYQDPYYGAILMGNDKSDLFLYSFKYNSVLSITSGGPCPAIPDESAPPFNCVDPSSNFNKINTLGTYQTSGLDYAKFYGGLILAAFNNSNGAPGGTHLYDMDGRFVETTYANGWVYLRGVHYNTSRYKTASGKVYLGGLWRFNQADANTYNSNGYSAALGSKYFLGWDPDSYDPATFNPSTDKVTFFYKFINDDVAHPLIMSGQSSGTSDGFFHSQAQHSPIHVGEDWTSRGGETYLNILDETIGGPYFWRVQTFQNSYGDYGTSQQPEATISNDRSWVGLKGEDGQNGWWRVKLPEPAGPVVADAYINNTVLDTTPPSNPTNVSIGVDLGGQQVLSSDSVTLAWLPSVDAESAITYDVYRDGVVVGSTTNTYFPDSGLQPSTSYNYQVLARSIGGSSALVPASPGLVVTTLSGPVAQTQFCTDPIGNDPVCDSSNYSLQVFGTSNPPVWEVGTDATRTVYQLSNSNAVYSANTNLLGAYAVTNQTYNDFSFTAEMATGDTSGSADVAVVWGLQDAGGAHPEYYFVSLNTNDTDSNLFNWVYKVASGQRTPIAALDNATAGRFHMSTYGGYHNVEVSRVGTTHTVKIDGVTYASFTDSDLSGGSVGFGSINDIVMVDNATITTNVVAGAPSTPSGFTVQNLTPPQGQIFLEWNYAGDETYYQINRTNTATNVTTVETVTVPTNPAPSVGDTLTHFDANANAAVRYEYTLQAGNVALPNLSAPTSPPLCVAVQGSGQTCGAGTVYHVLQTGQSLSIGSKGQPPLSTSQPYNNLMLSSASGVYPELGPRGVGTSLIPLVETAELNNNAQNGQVETSASGLANTLAAFDNQVNPSRQVAITLHGTGGAEYDVIKKGGTGTNYADGQTQAANVQAATIAQGGTYQPIGVTLIHGEQDGSDGNTAYEADLDEFQLDYQSDMRVLTGNNSLVLPMFLNQMNSRDTRGIPMQQLSAIKTNPNLYMVGPTYQYASPDGSHLTNAGYRALGEKYAEVMDAVVFQGQNWMPVHPTSVTRSGDTITVDFHVPNPPLQKDVSLVAQRPDFGFEFEEVGGIGTSIDATAPGGGVTFVDGDTIEIKLDSVPTGTNQTLYYSAQDLSGFLLDPSNGATVGGNIRDSNTAVSPASDSSGQALYNWAVAFAEPIVAGPPPQVGSAFCTDPIGNTAACDESLYTELIYNEVSPTQWAVTTDGVNTVYATTTSSYGPAANDGFGAVSFLNTPDYGDFEFDVRMRTGEVDPVANPTADIGLVFGYQNATDYYYLMLNAATDNGPVGSGDARADRSNLYRVQNGQARSALLSAPGLRDPAGNQFELAFGTYYDVRIRRIGSTIQVFIDDTPNDGIENYVDYTDGGVTDSTYGAGKIGFGSYNDIVVIDSAEVSVPAPANPVATSVTSLQAGIQNVATVNAIVSFDQAINPATVVASAFSVDQGASIGSITQNTGSEFNIEIDLSGVSLDAEDVTFSLNASSPIQNQSGLTLDVANSLDTDTTFTIDNIAPSISSSGSPLDSNNSFVLDSAEDGNGVSAEHDSIALIWDFSEGSSSNVVINVYRDTSPIPAGTTPPVAHVYGPENNGLGFTDSPLNADTTYHYRITATDGAGNISTFDPSSIDTAQAPDTDGPTLTLENPQPAVYTTGNTITAVIRSTEAATLTHSCTGASPSTIVANQNTSVSIPATVDGAYTCTIDAVDGAGNPSNQLTITSTVDNQSPSVVFQNLTTNAVRPLISGTITDSLSGLDEASIMISYNSPNTSAVGPVTVDTYNAASNTWEYMPPVGSEFLQGETYSITIQADDQAGNTFDAQVGTVTINPPQNQAPTANAGTDDSIDLLNTNSYTLLGAATDDGLPNGSTLSTVWSVLDEQGSNAVLNGKVSLADPMQLSTVATFAAEGVYTFTLTASDTALTGQDSVIITVRDTTAPILTMPGVPPLLTGGNQVIAIYASSETGTLNLGPDCPATQSSLFVSGNTTVVFDLEQPLVGTSRQYMCSATMTATDNGEVSDSVSFTVTYDFTGPTLQISNGSLDPGTNPTVAGNVTGLIDDESGVASLLVEVADTSNPLNQFPNDPFTQITHSHNFAVVPQSGVWQTPDFTWSPGTYNVRARATDNITASAPNFSESFATYVVSNQVVNTAPIVTIDPAVSQTVDLANTNPITINLDSTILDDNYPGTTLTSTWSVTDASGADASTVVNIADVTSEDTTATVATIGEFTFALSVTDTEYTTPANPTQTLTVIDSAVPGLSLSNLPNDPTNAATVSSLQITVDEPGVLAYGSGCINPTLGTSITTPGTYAASFSLLPDQRNTCVIGFTSSVDGQQAQTVSWTTFQDQTAPQVQIDDVITTDTSFPIAGTIDDDSLIDSLLIQVTPFGQGTVVHSHTFTNPATGTWQTPAFDWSGLGLGTYTVFATPTDELGNTVATPVTGQVTLSAVASNTAPVVEAGTNGEVDLRIGNTYTLSGSYIDDGLPNSPPGSHNVTTTWNVSPGTATITDTSSLTPVVSFSQVGTYTFTLTADDGALFALDTTTITVTESSAPSSGGSPGGGNGGGPSKPLNVRAESPDDSTVVIGWDKARRADSYAATCNGRTEVSIPGTQLFAEFTGFAPNTDVSCEVRSIRRNRSSRSAFAMARTLQPGMTKEISIPRTYVNSGGGDSATIQQLLARLQELQLILIQLLTARLQGLSTPSVSLGSPVVQATTVPGCVYQSGQRVVSTTSAVGGHTNLRSGAGPGFPIIGRVEVADTEAVIGSFASCQVVSGTVWYPIQKGSLQGYAAGSVIGLQ